MPIPAQLVECDALSVSGERKATNANKGTIERSSNNNVETTRWPLGVELMPRSSKTCMTIAVEESVNPIAAMKAIGKLRFSK